MSKIATALIPKEALIELLKVPHGMELTGIKYPSRDDKVEITLKGDSLPVKKVAKNAKKLPEIGYTVLRHWHVAKITEKD